MTYYLSRTPQFGVPTSLIRVALGTSEIGTITKIEVIHPSVAQNDYEAKFRATEGPSRFPATKAYSEAQDSIL